jgi:hypothetical protein
VKGGVSGRQRWLWPISEMLCQSSSKYRLSPDYEPLLWDKSLVKLEIRDPYLRSHFIGMSNSYALIKNTDNQITKVM